MNLSSDPTGIDAPAATGCPPPKPSTSFDALSIAFARFIPSRADRSFLLHLADIFVSAPNPAFLFNTITGFPVYKYSASMPAKTPVIPLSCT